MNIIRVSKHTPADCKTIGEALLSAKQYDGQPVTIQIGAGIYKEKLTVNQPFLTFLGENPENTVVTYNDYARFIMEDGEKRGTFRSWTLFVDTHHFTAKNLTIENSAGLGKDVGQGLAVYADGDQLLFENCRLLGAQDTLFTGPLPAVAYEKNGFRGPKEFSPRINGSQHYKDCYICGEIDFIFGSATAFFENCEICNIESERMPKGFATAGSTPEGQEFGYVFHRCRFTGEIPKGSAYLGRPWRDYAKCVILESEIGPHIAAEGWDDWSKAHAHDTVFYGEFGNYGAGADMTHRPDWIKRLTKDEAMNILSGIRKQFV